MYRYHSLQVISQDMQIHFGPDIIEPSRQKMSGLHPAFERSKRMLNRLLPDEHTIGHR